MFSRGLPPAHDPTAPGVRIQDSDLGGVAHQTLLPFLPTVAQPGTHPEVAVLSSHQATRCPGELAAVCAGRETAAIADRLDDLLPSLGSWCNQDKLDRNNSVPRENEIPHGTAKLFCGVSGKGRGCSLHTHPLVWWPHMRMTPNPQCLNTAIGAFTEGQS